MLESCKSVRNQMNIGWIVTPHNIEENIMEGIIEPLFLRNKEPRVSFIHAND